MWCHLPTGFNRRHSLRHVAVASLFIALITTLIFSHVTQATAGINQTINFQGRLLNAQGATVADGYYNIQFKIYQDGDGQSAGDTTGSPSGSLKWTETYINNNVSTGAVLVKNGFLSVNLGSKTPFGSSIDWNQNNLWLSMNVAGSAVACTTYGTAPCAADGEMLPMKQLTASPYALNSQSANTLGGTLTASNFVQLAQGVQTDASTNTSSIFINKTSTGNLLELQNTANDVFTVGNAGDLTFGSNANHTLSVATAAASTAGKSLTISSGAGGSGTGSAGGDLMLQGGVAGGTNANGGALTLDAGAKTGTGADGAINIGTSHASTIQIGSTTLSSGTVAINIGNNNTVGSTTNVTIGAGSSATGGATAIQSKGNTTISTNGVARATFDTSGNLYVGNGPSSAAPSNFNIQGTASSGTGVAGGSLTVQGGNATTGSANGGNLTLSGGTGFGTGVGGLVVLTTPTFQTVSTTQSCSSSCTITQSSVDSNSAIVVTASASSLTISLPNPTISGSVAYGRVVYVTAANATNDFTLAVNGGGGNGNQIAMRQNTSATMIWGPNGWTAAGASSSTTLQAAYNNTLQSSGGAELVVAKTSSTNGLTIRDSSVNSVNGALFQIQSSSAANLFSVSSNVTEYANDPGAEVAGGSSSTFPASTWAAIDGNTTATRYTTAGNYINTGQGSVQAVTTANANTGLANTLTGALNANMTYNVSLSTRLLSGTFTDMSVYYSYDGTAAHTVACANGQSSLISVWQKVSCSFTAPASGITASNSILIEQATGIARTFYIDNLSVSIAAGQNYATDGGVDDNTNFGTNWPAVGTASVSRNTSDGNDTSDSAQVSAGTTANNGIRNKLSISPLASTLYRVSTYAKLNAGSAFSDFKVRYSRDGGTNYVDCVDYNTQTVVTTGWTQITCYINTDGTAPSSPYVYFVQPTAPASARTFSVDTFSMTLGASTTPDVQIGSGVSGGPVTLFTLDKAASAPIAANNASLFGSMYYDTSQGKIQCYQASGWGACGASPDNIITISPEYTNAVMHGTGVGTMTSDFCSSSLAINDGSSGQPSICGSGQTYNFYKWTSPQATSQSYSIYVTYQLPGTLKTFTSGTTSLQGKTDSSNSSITYQIYRNTPGNALVACGSTVSVSTGVQSSWQTGVATGTADPSTCGFSAGDSIVFKITTSSSSNANAYIGNLGFTFSNK